MKTKYIKIRRRGEEKTWEFKLGKSEISGAFEPVPSDSIQKNINDLNQWREYNRAPWEFDLVDMWDPTYCKSCGTEWNFGRQSRPLDICGQCPITSKEQLKEICKYCKKELKENCDLINKYHFYCAKELPKENYQPFKNGCILCGKTTGCTHSNDETIEFLKKHEPKESARVKLSQAIIIMESAYADSKRFCTTPNQHYLEFIGVRQIKKFDEIVNDLKTLLAREDKLDEARKIVNDSIEMRGLTCAINISPANFLKLKELLDE